MTIHWKAIEQYFTVMLFACSLGKFIEFWTCHCQSDTVTLVRVKELRQTHIEANRQQLIVTEGLKRYNLIFTFHFLTCVVNLPKIQV